MLQANAKATFSSSFFKFNKTSDISSRGSRVLLFQKCKRLSFKGGFQVSLAPNITLSFYMRFLEINFKLNTLQNFAQKRRIIFHHVHNTSIQHCQFFQRSVSDIRLTIQDVLTVLTTLLIPSEYLYKGLRMKCQHRSQIIQCSKPCFRQRRLVKTIKMFTTAIGHHSINFVNIP